MIIEIIEEPAALPLNDLIDYLNIEIYPKMDKKDVEKIQSSCLGGSLFREIKKYYIKQKAIDNMILKKEHDLQIESLKDEVRRLRDGKEREVYKKRSDNYVGD